MAVALAPPHRLGLKPPGGDGSAAGGAGGGGAAGGAGAGLSGGPLLYVAAGHQEVALWDVAASRPVQVRAFGGAFASVGAPWAGLKPVVSRSAKAGEVRLQRARDAGACACTSPLEALADAQRFRVCGVCVDGAAWPGMQVIRCVTPQDLSAAAAAHSPYGAAAGAAPGGHGPDGAAAAAAAAVQLPLPGALQPALTQSTAWLGGPVDAAPLGGGGAHGRGLGGPDAYHSHDQSRCERNLRRGARAAPGTHRASNNSPAARSGR